MRYLFALAIAAVLSIGTAAAQETSETVVSFADIFNEYFMPAVVAAAATFAAWVIRKVDKLLGSKLSDDNRQALEQAVQRGIVWAADKVSTTVNEKKLTDVDVKNAIAAGALNYVTFYMPDTLKFFGITRDNLEARVQAQLAEMLGMDAIAAEAAGPRVPPPVAPPVEPSVTPAPSP